MHDREKSFFMFRHRVLTGVVFLFLLISLAFLLCNMEMQSAFSVPVDLAQVLPPPLVFNSPAQAVDVSAAERGQPGWLYASLSGVPG